jgi:hypothetical protein
MFLWPQLRQRSSFVERMRGNEEWEECREKKEKPKALPQKDTYTIAEMTPSADPPPLCSAFHVFKRKLMGFFSSFFFFAASSFVGVTETFFFFFALLPRSCACATPTSVHYCCFNTSGNTLKQRQWALSFFAVVVIQKETRTSIHNIEVIKKSKGKRCQ